MSKNIALDPKFIITDLDPQIENQGDPQIENQGISNPDLDQIVNWRW